MSALFFEFWGVPGPEPKPNRQITWRDLTADPNDEANWSLIALRFPMLADVVPPPQFSVKSHSANPGESGSQLATDLDQVRHLGSGASLADISEVLTGDRSYGGAMHKRLREIKRLLKTSTTTPQRGGSSTENQRRAA